MNLLQHREGLNTVKHQRRLLDESFARLIAAGVKDGHSVSDLLDEPVASPDQKGFDL